MQLLKLIKVLILWYFFTKESYLLKIMKLSETADIWSAIKIFSVKMHFEVLFMSDQNAKISISTCAGNKRKSLGFYHPIKIFLYNKFWYVVKILCLIFIYDFSLVFSKNKAISFSFGFKFLKSDSTKKKKLLKNWIVHPFNEHQLLFFISTNKNMLLVKSCCGNLWIFNQYLLKIMYVYIFFFI